jgi:hypothetical protein
MHARANVPRGPIAFALAGFGPPTRGYTKFTPSVARGPHHSRGRATFSHLSGSTSSAATIGMCALFIPSMPIFLIFVLLLISGFSRSLQFAATQAMTYSDVHHPQMSTATSIAGMSQQLSRGFGVSFVALLLQLSLAWRSESTLGTTDFTVASTDAARSRCCPSASAGPCATMRRPKSAATGQNRRRYRPRRLVLLPNRPPHLDFSPIRNFSYNDVTLRVNCNTMRVCEIATLVARPPEF